MYTQDPTLLTIDFLLVCMIDSTDRRFRLSIRACLVVIRVRVSSLSVRTRRYLVRRREFSIEARRYSQVRSEEARSDSEALQCSNR